MRIVLMMLMLMIALPAVAQTLTTDAPVPEKAWEILLKVLFPAIWTAVAPMLTRGVTQLLLKVMSEVPQYLQVPISTILGGLAGAVAGAIPDFPLTVESAATMGAAGGATGQVLLASNPGKIKGEPGAQVNP